MFRFSFSILILLFPLLLFAQFKGGRADGFVMSTNSGEPLVDQAEYCEGGSYDGFSLSTNLGEPLNIQSEYCDGGTDDGFAVAIHNGEPFNSQLGYCSGGLMDGFAKSSSGSTLNVQADYCSGGGFDGFSKSVFEDYIYNALIFSGGANDAFSFSSSGDTALGYGIWVGAYTNGWNFRFNWKHFTKPLTTSNVTIPSGCNYYPRLIDTITVNYPGGFYVARRIDILSGGVLNTHSAVLVNGEVNVWGAFNSETSIDTLIKIGDGGIVTIDSSGTMLLGQRTADSALTDLMIKDGGHLILHNGTLEIDDQLNIMNGGTLEMDDGILLVHKYGEGSPIGTGGNYSPVYVEAGAISNITGGSFRVVGKPSASSISAVQINEPGFSFGGINRFVVRYGDSPNHYDCEISAVPGVSFSTIRVMDNKKLIVKSDLHISTLLRIKPGAEVELETGNTITISDQ